MKTKTKNTALIIVNAVIAALVPGAWLFMALRGGGALSAQGLSSLRFFTVLSNILEGAASLWLVIELIGLMRGRREALSHRVYLLKYVSASAVAVTFSVVVFFFVPLTGVRAMYQGANFWYHLIVPVLAMAEFAVLDRFGSLSLWEAFLAPLPELIYGTGYAVNIIVNGVGEGPDTNDFYGFAANGLPAGFGIFGVVLIMSLLLGLLLRWGNRIGRKSDGT